MGILTFKKTGYYVVIKWLVNGWEWASNSKFTSRDKAEKFIKEEKRKQLSPNVTYEIVEI